MIVFQQDESSVVGSDSIRIELLNSDIYSSSISLKGLPFLKVDQYKFEKNLNELYYEEYVRFIRELYEIRLDSIMFSNSSLNINSYISSNYSITNSKFSLMNQTGAISIYAIGSVLTIDRCIFIDNMSEVGGSSIMAFSTYFVFIQRSVFENNIQTIYYNRDLNFGGGAIYLLQTYLFSKNNMFINNSANSLGGAIYTNYGAAGLATTNDTFISNRAYNGGAICATGYQYNYKNAISDTRLSLSVSNSIFKENYAEKAGGAIMTQNAIITFKVEKEPTLNSSKLISNNTAYVGSGLYMVDGLIIITSASRIGTGTIYNTKTINNIISYNNNYPNNNNTDFTSFPSRVEIV